MDSKTIFSIGWFLVGTLFMYNLFGTKATFYFLSLVLLGTLVTHAKNIESLSF